jgi:hypothetical protein
MFPWLKSWIKSLAPIKPRVLPIGGGWTLMTWPDRVAALWSPNKRHRWPVTPRLPVGWRYEAAGAN